MDRTLISISQRMTWCALPKTEPVGDELQSTALLSTDDDDESNTKNPCHSSFKLTLVP